MRRENFCSLKQLMRNAALCVGALLPVACASSNQTDWYNAPSASAEMPADSFISLCYHNVEDEDPDQRFDGVSSAHLVEQMSWLKHEGYHPVSIDQILAAKAGKKPLPPKAVLLSFDDGYKSFYTRVYPILQVYHYPAVLGIVDEWMTGSATPTKGHPGDRVHYGETTMPRSAFLTWDEVREMKRSGLVEIASHSHALHYGTVANPQGNTEPVAVSLAYNTKTHSYETPAHYQAKLDEDAAESADTLQRETGSRPRVMIWPYGAYNRTSVDAEKKHGMPITLTLDDGFANIHDLSAVPRFLVKDDPNIEDFAISMRQIGRPEPVRSVQIDLDYIYDPDPAQTDRNVDALVSRLHDMKISTVYLQGFADPHGTGIASATYFPNRVLPMRADLFNRVAWQLDTRDDIKVYGWLPVSSFDLKDVTPVMAWDPGTDSAAPDAKAYHRASIFDPKARHLIEEIYEDMARYGSIDGVLYHDDALLSDFEDASPAALEAYKKAGLPDSIKALRADPATLDKWTNFKTRALIDFTNDLTRHMARYRSPLTTVRNIYATPVLKPNSEEWFAQNYQAFLHNYDYTAIEAMPAMENVPESDADEWFATLVKTATQTEPDALRKSVFELQSVDWRKAKIGEDRRIDASVLSKQMRYLALHSATNFGYYPDDFITDTPRATEIHKDFSLQTYPYRP